MRDWTYQNKQNEHKFIEVRRYADGHYVWKQYIHYPRHNGHSVLNYIGCSIKRCHTGVWHRVNKKTMLEVLQDYELVL